MDVEVSANVYVQALPMIDSLAGYGILNRNPFLPVSKTWLHCILVSSPALLEATFPGHHAAPFHSSLHRQDSPVLFTPLLSGLQPTSPRGPCLL